MELAVIGAGVSGLGAAVSLADTDVDVTVYERRASVGGRAATRRREDCVYDVGANYLTSGDEQVNSLVRALGEDDLVDADGPVWTFDSAGNVAPGESDDDHKWTYRNGLSELGERLAERAAASVHTETEVERVAPDGDGWEVAHDGGRERFDAALLTPPAPVTAEILAGGAAATDALAEAAASVPYRPVLTAILHYPFEIERPYYALVNDDKDHELGWLARESAKPGHVPAGESVLVAQMAPDWSAAHLDDGAVASGTVDDVADTVATLLDDKRLADPDWTDCVGWEHALADDTADPMTVAHAASEGLFVAGDWTVGGKSRLHTALRGGLDVGAAIADYR